MVGTRFGWDSAPQLPYGETNDVFGEHVTTAFTGATRIIHFIDVRFASVISPKLLFDNRSRFPSSCFDLGWKASYKAHFGTRVMQYVGRFSVK